MPQEKDQTSSSHLIRQGKLVALIPARGGSKGIALKNLAELEGQSLIERKILQAQSLRIFDAVWVSTDNLRIAALAQDLGCLVHNRSAEASSDTAIADDVIKEFGADSNLHSNDYICYLQPTSPLISLRSILSAVTLGQQPEYMGALSVTEVSQHCFKQLKFDKIKGVVLAIDSKRVSSNRQLGQTLLYPTGGVYVFRYGKFLKDGNFQVDGMVPIVVSKVEAIDIDSQEDLELARLLVKEEDNAV